MTEPDRPVPRDQPGTPENTRQIVDELDAKVEAEVPVATEEGDVAPDRAPETPTPEPPD